MQRSIIKFLCSIMMLLLFPIVALYGFLDELYNRLESQQEGQNDK